MRRIWILVFAAMGLLSCADRTSKQNDADEKLGDVAEAIPTFVDTVRLHKGIFQREVVSTGKLRPAKSADLRFRISGILSEIRVKNGDIVRKGDVIAVLDRQQAALELESAENALKRSWLSLMDMVVGYGYGSDTASLPKELLSVAKIKSGYKDALFQYKKASMEYENTVLTAPFDGIVANLSARTAERVPDVLCRLFDPASMEVEFPLLESESDFMKKGADVVVVPFSAPERSNVGKVSEINPLVDNRGQVALRARLYPPYEGLMSGMSVKVYLRMNEDDCYVVPKSAVVIRDGFDVIFLYNEDRGTASWLYVDVLMSNSREHVVSGCKVKGTALPENGWVIVTGNLNLADEAKVAVQS